MLSFFRRLVASSLGKLIMFLVLGVIAAGFLMADLSGGIGGGGSGAKQTIAKVGSTKITADEVSRAVSREIANARQQEPGLDPAMFAAAGGVERSFDGVIGSRALEQFAADQGLAAGKRAVDGEIASISAFNGPSGKFDQATFQAALAQNRLTEPEVRREIRGEVLRRLLLLPVAGGAKAPTGVVNNYAALLMETRKGMIGFVPTAAMPAGPAPTDAAIHSYYKTNIARFSLGERRVIRYALFGPETATIAPPSDADIAAAYAADPSYAGKATRTLSQVVFPDQAAATAFSAKLKGGTAFAAAAQAAGYAPADTALGAQTEKQFADVATPAAAATVFALPQGGVSAPQKSELGWHVVRVDAIENTPAKPLASVRGAIIAKLDAERRKAAVADQVNAIDDELGKRSSFDDVAKQHKLTILTTPPLLADGRAPGVAGWKQTPVIAAVVAPAFKAAPDDDPVVQPIGTDGAQALVALVRVDKPMALPLAAVRGAVAQAIQTEGAMRAAKAMADAIVVKASKGVALGVAFAQAGVPLPAPLPAGARRLDISKPDAKVPPALAALFSMVQGRARLIPAPGGQGWFVAKLDVIVKGDPATAPGLVEATQQQFAPVFANEYADQFARATQATLGVTRDEAAFRALKAQIVAGGASPQ